MSLWVHSGDDVLYRKCLENMRFLSDHTKCDTPLRGVAGYDLETAKVQTVGGLQAVARIIGKDPVYVRNFLGGKEIELEEVEIQTPGGLQGGKQYR